MRPFLLIPHQCDQCQLQHPLQDGWVDLDLFRCSQEGRINPEGIERKRNDKVEDRRRGGSVRL